MARDEVKKHQPATPVTTNMENLETKVLEMLALRDANSLCCACGILGLVVPDQKKGILKLLLKYILRHFNSEDVEGSNDGGSSWYTKLHDHFE